MSNRTLLEFNHDFGHRIADDPAPFLSALDDMIRGGPSDHNLPVLGHYGVKWHGQRHHSDGFDIKWGGHKSSETSTR